LAPLFALIKERFTGLTYLRSNLGEPDDGLYRLQLTEKQSDPAERVMPPVLKETGPFKRNVLVARVRPASPLVHGTAETVYCGRGIVLLILGRKPLTFVENGPLLFDSRAFAAGCYAA
jgi:hypothetical protein